MKKSIFWDQDGTLVERPKNGNPLNINSSGARVLPLFKKDFINYHLSAKDPVATRRRTEEAGFNQYFEAHFDSRGKEKGKYFKNVRVTLGVSNQDLRDSSIYVGNSLEYDIIRDVSRYVHIIDKSALKRDLFLYKGLIDLLLSVSSSFSKAFEIKFKESENIHLDEERFKLFRLQGYGKRPEDLAYIIEAT
ncbi:hypothetical protein HZA98_03125 [Candidatus Woesearchaeota archaeon]|nr:hypothetical protein [Candidatus Woesearchaeota archaeon]